jgi:hypothetical protein
MAEDGGGVEGMRVGSPGVRSVRDAGGDIIGEAEGSDYLLARTV